MGSPNPSNVLIVCILRGFEDLIGLLQDDVLLGQPNFMFFQLSIVLVQHVLMTLVPCFKVLELGLNARIHGCGMIYGAYILGSSYDLPTPILSLPSPFVRLHYGHARAISCFGAF